MIDKRWTIQSPDEQYVAQLRKDLANIHPALHQILAMRGISDYTSAKGFFRPQLEELHDPMLMHHMDKAIARIDLAASRQEKIMVFGDYDVDGTTSVAVVYSFLKNKFEDRISYYIPHRYHEGYGLSKKGIDHARAEGITLIITLDCGIKSAELVAYGSTLGIDFIICDHHLPDEHLPGAVAILNPKQPDCRYPYKELSGCGIGFKLISALCKLWHWPMEEAHQFLDLVATSIAADIVPIDGENRILAFYGIKKVNENPSLPIRTIKEVSNIYRKLEVSDLVFVVGPRVNAAGRMDDARKAVDFFIEKDPMKSIELAKLLQSDNVDRKLVDHDITTEAISMLLHDPSEQDKKSTVLYQPHWHKGVVGIVASRLIDHYYRPTIVLTLSNGMVSGSARSIPGFNIHAAICECGDLLENFGGHYFAAGMTMKEENVKAFQQRFEEIVCRTIDPKVLTPEILIDAELDLQDVNDGLYKILRQLEPFGPTNMRPVFVSRKVRNHRSFCRIVKDAHLRFVIADEKGATANGIGFNMAEKFPLVAEQPFDIVYTIEENEYNGNINLQLKVLDVKACVS